MPLQGGDQRFLQWQPDATGVARCFQLRIDADHSAGFAALALEKREHLVERWDGEPSVIRVRPRRKALACATRPQLGDGEVFGEPAGDRVRADVFDGPPIWKAG